MKTKLKINEGVALVDVALRMIKLVLSSASFFVLMIFHNYAIDAAQWSMGPVHVCFGATNKRKAFKISSII
jgi:hypothetical protein